MQPDKSIQLAFVRQALDQYNRRVSEELAKSIDRLDAKVTGERRLSILTRTKEANASFEGQSHVLFHEYGRMVDMDAGRNVSRKGKKTAREKRELNKMRRPKKFYSPTAYGLLNPLINELQYGLTEEVIANIQQQFEHVR
jgi:hypothetical protein